MKLFITTLAFLVTISLSAQNDLSTNRKGFVFSTAFGSGATIQSFPQKKQKDFDFALSIELGFMINSKLAILLGSNVTIYDYSGIGRDRKRDFGILSPSIKYWVKDFWISGGVGLGGDNPVFYDLQKPENNPLESKYYNGFGIVAASGFEFGKFKRFSLDTKFRISYRNVNISEGITQGISTALLLGINFN